MDEWRYTKGLEAMQKALIAKVSASGSHAQIICYGREVRRALAPVDLTVSRASCKLLWTALGVWITTRIKCYALSTTMKFSGLGVSKAELVVPCKIS